MKRIFQSALLIIVIVGVMAACSSKTGPLTGKWTLEISNYKDSCGNEPTVDPVFQITQTGKKLEAVAEIADAEGKMHKAVFKGEMSQLQPPASASLVGKFTIAGFTTEETMDIQIIDEKTFSGHAKWENVSADKKTVCIGSDDIKGTKK